MRRGRSFAIAFARRSAVWSSAALVVAAPAWDAPAPSSNRPDPDQGAKASTDVDLSLRTISSGFFELVVQNQSGVGYIDSFAWVPGPGWRVTSIAGTSSGTCVVSSGAMSCNAKIAPPTKCTCLPGGQMAIRFRMSGPRTPRFSKSSGNVVIGTAGGYLVVKTVTLIHRHIPTELPANT
jgi:hypothetical protein